MSEYLNCIALLDEVRSIREDSQVEQAVRSATEQHDHETMLSIDPNMFTELIVGMRRELQPDQTISIKDLTNQYFAQRSKIFDRYYADLPALARSAMRFGDGSKSVKAVSAQTEKKLAELSLSLALIERAYMNVAKQSGCSEQLRMLFKLGHEEERKKYSKII